MKEEGIQLLDGITDHGDSPDVVRRPTTHRKFNYIACVLVFAALIFVTFGITSRYDSDSNSVKESNVIVLKDVVGNNVEEMWKAYFGGKPHKTSSFNCDAFFESNEMSLQIYNTTGRLLLNDNLNIPMDCASIRRRVMGNNEYRKIRSIAFARNVYENYAMQEAFLSMSYNPRNVFCFALFSNSSTHLSNSLDRLEKCFPNVVVLNQTFAFDSAGHYQDIAYFECIKELSNFKQWTHVLSLQNDDLVLRTPDELSELSEILQSASGVSTIKAQTYRYDADEDWSPSKLHLWKNETSKTEEQLHRNLTVTKSLFQTFLSRTFVDSLSDNLNLKEILHAFNEQKYYGVDEMLVSTLFSNGWMGLSGQVKAGCGGDDFVRYTHWNFAKLGDDSGCWSHQRRHGICIIGVEYIQMLRDSVFIIGNKVKPSFDFGTTMCMAEYLHDLSTGKKNRTMNRVFYENTRAVREMKEIEQKGQKYDEKQFKCTSE